MADINFTAPNVYALNDLKGKIFFVSRTYRNCFVILVKILMLCGDSNCTGRNDLDILS